MVNNINIVGNLAKAPQQYTTQDGKAIAKFDIAVNAGKDKVHFFPVVAFGTPAEFALKYLDKGSKVAISGQLSQSTYQAQDGTKRSKIEIVAQAIEGMANTASRGERTAQNDILHEIEDAEEDMPF